jgi:hypothetical protein
MYRAVERKEIKRVKRNCLAIAIGVFLLLLLSTRYHWIWDLGNSIYGWIIMGIISLTLAAKAIQATRVQAYYNKYPWEQEGAERL